MISLGIGAMVFVWQQLRLWTGARDLTIDRFAKTVTLPISYKRWGRVTLPLAGVSKVSSEKIEHGENTHPSYAVTIHSSVDGQTRADRIVEWLDELKAKAFAEWVGEQVLGS